jgi:hypothetical protein
MSELVLALAALECLDIGMHAFSQLILLHLFHLLAVLLGLDLKIKESLGLHLLLLPIVSLLLLALSLLLGLLL